MSYVCRAKFIKQNAPKPTVPSGLSGKLWTAPGPGNYEAPPIIGGKGYSLIKRTPAYTFGIRPPLYGKQAVKPNAPVFNVQGLGRKGVHKITHSVITPRIKQPGISQILPGPNKYHPQSEVILKRPPAYTMQPRVRPSYEDSDQWTPPPNMYWPPTLGKSPPKYTMGYGVRRAKPKNVPGPCDHNPNYDYVLRTKPAFSLKGRPRSPKLYVSPSPAQYCEEKFNVTFKTTPAPSFGIRHSTYLGQAPEYLRSSKLDLLINDKCS